MMLSPRHHTSPAHRGLGPAPSLVVLTSELELSQERPGSEGTVRAVERVSGAGTRPRLLTDGPENMEPLGVRLRRKVDGPASD